MRILILLSLILIQLSCATKVSFNGNSKTGNEFTKISMDFLDSLKNNNSTREIKLKLSQTKLNDLVHSFENDQQVLAFWINIYNAYIQDILNVEPDLYRDRGSFFREPRIHIAGMNLSFGDIEHGIIRRSQNEYGLGYLTKWFPPKWERKLRVANRDYRVHFALNCGAKDCPPVVIFDPKRINDQLNLSTARYLQNHTELDSTKSIINVTPLCSWFRGDFGGKKGIKKILKKNNLIPAGLNPKIRYMSYDWTLELNNYINL